MLRSLNKLPFFGKLLITFTAALNFSSVVMLKTSLLELQKLYFACYVPTFLLSIFLLDWRNNDTHKIEDSKNENSQHNLQINVRKRVTAENCARPRRLRVTDYRSVIGDRPVIVQVSSLDACVNQHFLSDYVTMRFFNRRRAAPTVVEITTNVFTVDRTNS